MAFMAGDSEHGVPRFVEVEWSIWPKAVTEEMDRTLYTRPDKFSAAWEKDYDAYVSRIVRHTRRIDLTPIITPELVAQVRADPQSTHLKLTVTFKDDEVSLAAEAYQWRKTPFNGDSK